MGKKSAATKAEPKRRGKKGASDGAKGAAAKSGAAAPKGEISGKDYARAMKKLHVELVKLQEWVKLKGLKVCIVFEGRDGAARAHHRDHRRVARGVRVIASLRRPSEKSQIHAAPSAACRLQGRS
jgi:polyphosphate kinase 2 (PPK2 family)